MPAIIWERGRELARKDKVTIDSINTDIHSVDATVLGTHEYGVTVDGDTQEADYCECPYFPEHGYCKHIAAVITELKKEGLPIDTLFADDFPTLATAELADDFSQLDPQVPEIFQPTPSKSRDTFKSGATFINELAIPTSDYGYYEPLQLISRQALNLEVTLFLDEMPRNYYDSRKTGFFLKLKIGLAEPDARHYVVRDVSEFLGLYQQEAAYQTGGKAQFQLTSTVFSKAEQQLLEYMTKAQAEQADVHQETAKHYSIPIHLFKSFLALLKQVEHFTYQPDEKGPVYQQVVLKNFEPQDCLVHGGIRETADEYLFYLLQDYQHELKDYNLFVRDNVLYQATNQQMAAVRSFSSSYNQNVDYQLRREQKMVNPVEVELPDGKFTVPTIQFAKSEKRQLARVIDYFQTIGELELPASLTTSRFLPHFKLDKKSSQLTLFLEYQYGDTVVPASQVAQSPLAEHRNLEQEEATTSYLWTLGFQAHGEFFGKAFPQADELYHFFMRELPNLKKNGIVSVSPELNQFMQTAERMQPRVNVSEKDGFLAVNFSLEGVNESEIDQFLAQLDVARPYIERADGSIVLIDERLRKVQAALLKIRRQGKIKNGQLHVHASQALAIKAALAENDTATFDQVFKKLVTNLAQPEKFDYEQKVPVQATLRRYQKEGVSWLEMLDSYHFGGILADEMGLGKTLQMITFLVNHVEKDKATLIVTPASLIYNWQAEFEKFAPGMEVIVVEGTKAKRQQLIEDHPGVIFITSYNSARLDVASYQAHKLAYLVMDEAQYVKNASTKTNQSLRKLAPENTFALSGTPIENRIEELWAIFEVVMPGLLPSKKVFNKMSPADIAVRVKPFIMRREKAAVLTEIPDKVESNLYNELTKEQKAVYVAQLKQMQVKVKGLTGENFVKNKLEILAGITRLRQICDTPALYMDEYFAESGKMLQLLELLQQAKENKRHVLIFSQFTGMLDKIEAELATRNIPSFMIQGNTKPKDRLDMVNAFNDGERDVFLISLKAGGTGLNLTGADMVVLVDLWWNPAVEDQATARAH
jgi:superfamily II DNA or RNA helicase